MGISVSIYILLFLPLTFLLSSLSAARTIQGPKWDSMESYCHLKHLSSSDARLLIPHHQKARKSKGLSPEIAPAKHTPRITNKLSHHSSVLNERSLLSDSIHGGYRMIWRYAEVIVNSAQASKRHHRIYEKLLQEIGQPASPTSNFYQVAGNVGRLVITYGSMRLMVENLAGDHNALDIIQDFAVEMLGFSTVAMTYGVYQLAIVAVRTVMMISLTIAEFGPVPEIIGR